MFNKSGQSVEIWASKHLPVREADGCRTSPSDKWSLQHSNPYVSQVPIKDVVVRWSYL